MCVTSSRWLRLSGLVMATVTALLACAGDGPTADKERIELTANAESVSLVQGRGTTLGLHVRRHGGFTGPIILSVSGLPGGVTATISPEQFTDSNTTADATIDVAPTIPTGTYTGTVRATAAGVADASITFTLTVTPKPDFALYATPATLHVLQRDSTSVTIHIVRTDNFTDPVSLTLTVFFVGTQYSFPSYVTGDSAVLAFRTSDITPTGSGSLILMANGGPGVGIRFLTIPLTVEKPPGFYVSLYPRELAIPPSQRTTTLLNVGRSGSFTGPVTLSVDNPQAGITVTFAPSIVVANSAKVTVSVAATVPYGSYVLTVRGTGAGLPDAFDELTIDVRDPIYTLSLNPSVITVAAGTSATVAVAIPHKYVVPVTLLLDPPPPGISGSFNPVTTTGQASTLTLNVAAGTAPGVYTLSVRGTTPGWLDYVVPLQVTVR